MNASVLFLVDSSSLENIERCSNPPDDSKQIRIETPMKRLLLYTIVLFSFSGYVKCQTNDSITLYNNVLDYISRDLNVDIDSIAVSSIIYDLDSFFYIPVAESQEQKEMLIKRQNFSRGDFHSDILDSNFRKLSSSSKYCLFFSYLMDGVLLAEIYELQRFTKQIDLSFIVATSLRKYAYMLIISKEYEIVKSHKIELN